MDPIRLNIINVENVFIIQNESNTRHIHKYINHTKTPDLRIIRVFNAIKHTESRAIKSFCNAQ